MARGTASRKGESHEPPSSAAAVPATTSTARVPPARSAGAWAVSSGVASMARSAKPSTPKQNPNSTRGSARRTANEALFTGSGLKMGTSWRTA